MSAKRKVFDFEIERARRDLDGPEAYPGEALESVIVVLQSDLHSIVPETRDALIELSNLCRRIDARVAELLALPGR